MAAPPNPDACAAYEQFWDWVIHSDAHPEDKINALIRICEMSGAPAETDWDELLK